MKPADRQKRLIMIVAVLVGLFLGDRIVYSPLLHLWQARQNEIKRLRLQVADGTALVRRQDIVRGRWDSMRTNTLPNNQSLAQEQMLKTIQNWAQESGVSLNAVTPQWRNSDSEDYKTLICRIDASGSIGMLARFVYDLESGPLGLKLDSADFSSRDASGRQLSLGLQTSGLVLTPKEK